MCVSCACMCAVKSQGMTHGTGWKSDPDSKSCSPSPFFFSLSLSLCPRLTCFPCSPFLFFHLTFSPFPVPNLSFLYVSFLFPPSSWYFLLPFLLFSSAHLLLPCSFCPIQLQATDHCHTHPHTYTEECSKGRRGSGVRKKRCVT